MSLRPIFGNDGRSRSRVPLECGPIDPRAAPAFQLGAPQAGQHYSLQTITTGGAFQFAQSIDPMEHIFGEAGRAMDRLSFSIWIKFNQAPAATNGIINFGADAVSSATAGFDWISTTSATFWIFTRSTLANRSQIAVASPSGIWNHFVGTYDRLDGSGATIRLFLNGDNSAAVNGTHATARSWEVDHPLEVGREIFHSATTTNYPACQYHWLQVWNRQLTSGEAVRLYNGGTPLRTLDDSLTSGLRLFWKLGGSYQERQYAQLLAEDRANIGTVVDSSGLGFHGLFRSDDSSSAQFPTYILDSP